jgi:hypothetical protein
MISPGASTHAPTYHTAILGGIKNLVGSLGEHGH